MKHEHASDIDAAAVDSLKALDPSRPIREADSCNAAKGRLFDHPVGTGTGSVAFRLLALEDAIDSDHIVGYVGTIKPLESILIETGGRQVKHDTTTG